MVTVNSLSGGKTSSYMAAHYKADYDIFALVLADDPSLTPLDKSLVKRVSDKIGRQFIGTAESDLTLYAMFDLEQLIGRKITWVTGIEFGALNKYRSMLPNKVARFCTTEMKMRPIWDWWYKNIGEKVRMNIGFRYDESERAGKINNVFKGIVGSKNGRNKWKEIEWRTCSFPLIDDKIIHPRVYEWAKSSGIRFPQDSNCVGCFWKDPMQLRKNWEDEPLKMQWFSNQEKIIGGTFKDGIKYASIKNLMLQMDFSFGGGAGCQEESCTP